MERAPPTPVVLKKLKRVEKAQENGLKLTFCNLEYHEADGDNKFYLLTSHGDPFNPLKLYQSAMNKLVRNLYMAMEDARNLEADPDFEDNEHYDCGIINSHKNMCVQLVISTSDGSAHVWLRLYTFDENNNTIPTKFEVQFSQEDNLDALKAFVAANVPKPIPAMTG
jgi:hypothetical protein